MKKHGKEIQEMIKRITAIMLSTAMILSGVFALPPVSDAADVSSDLNAVKQAGRTYYGNMIDVSVYSDELFTRDARVFDTQLAVVSMNLCQASLNASKRLGFESSRILREYLTDNGFTDFEFNRDYTISSGDEVTTAVACAHKKVKGSDGKTYTLLAIVPRSATTNNEWSTSLKASGGRNDHGDHAGYSDSRDIVLEFARQYITDHGIKGDLKVWTSGFSRGAGFINLVGADLADHPRLSLGSSISLERKDIYCYNFGCPRAAYSDDSRDERYDCIHNIVDPGDVIANFPVFSGLFSRYGQDHEYAADPDKHDAMLEYLKSYYNKTYVKYENGSDPDDFTPYKIDIDALMSGKLGFKKDTGSYLPADRGDYMETIMETMSRTLMETAQSGENDKQRARNAYYDGYQNAMTDFVNAMVYFGFSMDFVTGSDYGIPMLLSMYVTVLIDQCMIQRTDDLNAAINTVFNQIALVVEDENGEVAERYRKAGSDYTALRDKYFVRDDKSGLYVLKNNVASNGIMLEKMLEVSKNLEAEFYRKSMESYLKSKECSQEVIDKITDEDNSKAVSYLLAHLLFDNVEQGRVLEDLKTSATEEGILEALINNQHFKSLATLLNNINPLTMPHLSEVMNVWLRIDDPYYKEYIPADEAQSTGYRRVYLPQPSGVNLTGSVVDAGGRTVATFRNGKLTSRTDEWIGITTSDNGNWLRIPAGASYKVYIGTDKACTYGLKLEEYSIQLEGVAQTIDGNGSWKSISSPAGGSAVLTLPALEESEKYYEMPSDPARVQYTLDTPGSVQPSGGGSSSASVDTLDIGVLTSGIPAVRSMKTKAAKKSFTVSWKKPSKKKLKKYNKVEIQYSTTPEFTVDTTRVREVSKNKRSCKIKKLKSKTTYYVRTRNIKYAYDRKYVSKWSKVKKIKVK